ncbi:MAG TPA: alpha/beta hydrolase, partial [Burkholderiaceae bacterium]
LWAALFALLSGCSSTAILDRMVPSDTYVARPSAAYGPEARQQLDIYLPLPAAGGARPPLVVFFYGGSWTTGERVDYRFVGEALASRGIATLVADYRLSPAVRYPVFLQDSAAAVKWAFEHAAELGADPARIYVAGHSAGAYNAAMVALDPRWLAQVGLKPAQLAGWVGIAGAYEFLPIGIPEVQVAFNWPHTPPDSQPVVHASARAPRTLLLAASSDTVVSPARNTQALASRLRAAGVPTAVQMYSGVSHVTVLASVATPLNFLAPVADVMATFVQGGAVSDTGAPAK